MKVKFPVVGKGLCVSLLLDLTTHVLSVASTNLNKTDMLKKVEELKHTMLHVMEKKFITLNSKLDVSTNHRGGLI